MENRSSVELGRRDFLSLLLKSVFALLGAGAAASLPFLYPPAPKRADPDSFWEYARAMEEDSVPRRGVRKAEFTHRDKKMRAYVVNNGGELFVLSPVCTHLGCLVVWDPSREEFACPCHGGKYSVQGAVKEGPPPAPLTRLPYRIENGAFYIGVKV